MSRNSQSSSSPLPKWLAFGSILWTAVNFITIISLQEQLSSLVESNPPGNAVNADLSDKKSASTSDTSTGAFNFDREVAENALQMHGHDGIFQPLRAYIEKPLNDTVPDTIEKGNLNEKRPKIEVGRPAMWYVPLPLRENTPGDVSRRQSIRQFLRLTSSLILPVSYDCKASSI
jgi:hypothetical protein